MDLSSKNEMELQGFTCYWRIESFFLRKLKSNLELVSSIFKENIFNEEWYLSLRQNVPGFLGLYLHKVNKLSIDINFSLSLSTSYEWVEIDKTKKNFNPKEKSYGIHEFISWKKISENQWTYLPNACLTVKCRIWNDMSNENFGQCVIISRLTTSLDLHHLAIQNYTSLQPKELLNFPASYTFSKEEKEDSLKELEQKKEKSERTQTENSIDPDETENLIAHFRKRKFGFATLRTTHKDFVVHKAILCANSPVFRAMFDRKVNQNDSNILEVDDIDSDTLASVLQLIHLERVDLKFSAAVKLYYAVNKLQIETLKRTCVVQLMKEFSNENICEAFILADMHRDKDLKQFAVKYFCENSKSILPSRDWKDLSLNKPLLASEILCKLVKKY